MQLKHETRHIESGYINCYGVTLNEYDVARYNFISDRISAFQDAGYQAREGDLIARHNTISKNK